MASTPTKRSVSSRINDVASATAENPDENALTRASREKRAKSMSEIVSNEG
jgi:hypothetical protein